MQAGLMTLLMARRAAALVPAGPARTVARRQRCALSAGRASAAVSQQSRGKAAAGGKLDLAPPRGTRDFYPEELRVRNWLFDQWRRTAAAHGFEARYFRGGETRAPRDAPPRARRSTTRRSWRARRSTCARRARR